jgi:hypothetical protein
MDGRHCGVGGQDRLPGTGGTGFPERESAYPPSAPRNGGTGAATSAECHSWP